MGNYCSSGQKKDKDNVSEKSEESPAYQIADKTQETKEPPLAQPEADSNDTNGIIKANDVCGRLNSTNQSGDSISASPMCISAPVDISTLLNLPQNLTSLYGRPTVSRRIEKDKKIVLYVLAADDSYQMEKSILQKLQINLQEYYRCKGFEIHISDIHVSESYSKTNTFDLNNWLDQPLEAQCGHHLAANCLAEITRHSTDSYVIPILFLNSTLGDPLLPLTIENQDFANAISAADNCGKLLLEKWYILDEKSQPSCYRLKSIKVEKENIANFDEELNSLMLNLVEIFSRELRDSYLTTVVEQEINNTVLMSQELAKRCLWIQNPNSQGKNDENMNPLEIEMNRRLSNIHNDLKTQLAEKHIIKMPVASQQQQEQFLSVFHSSLSSEIDAIIDEHTNKFQIPYCTFGVDRRLLTELEEVNRHSQILNQNCANFSIIENVKSYLNGNSTSPLIVYGKNGSGKSVLSAKIAQSIHTWIPECSFVLRYSNLTAISSDITSILSTITEQISVLLKESPNECIHTQQSYTKLFSRLIHKAKHQIVILIDSVDKLYDIKDMDWLPTELVNNVKIILTVTSTSKNHDDFDSTSLLKALKVKINAQNFLYLSSFTQEQWEDVLTFGSGATNGALQLPESWKKSDEKAPIQAKILWWLAWLGQRKLENLSISHISEKVFEILENKFGLTTVKYLITLITASRDGLLETEIFEMLESSKIVDGSITKLWTNFSWTMGPLLLHNKNIKIMDSTIRAVAEKRYESDMECAHKILHDYFVQQPNVYFDSKKKESCYNTRKFTELPYHSFKIDKKEYETSQYLTNLTWLHDKIDSTGCVQLLFDIYLISPPVQSNEMSPNARNIKLAEHIEFLIRFLEIHFKSLNYDAQQLQSLLSTFIKAELSKRSDLSSNSIIQGWQNEIKSGDAYIERLYIENDDDDNDEEISENGDECDSNKNGYDFLINTNVNESFAISLSTDREEICVWNVLECSKVRTLNGVPQPSSVCLVGEYELAVLCKREIRVLDLNEGKFKVTLKGVMNQKMPYFGLHDPQHLVCLSRNRMYVNLMNMESGDCVTTFKAGEDRFLNSLLVSGDGRILVCGDETSKPFPLLVWHLTQRKLLYDLRIPHHDFITSLSAITHEGSYVCVVAKELNEPAPNFIVVYDLQSGTLFKKWKPSCNTVSLAISQANTCVIAGLEDARILIWDLVTGNCRCSLTGHNAPVTLLKLDPLGKVLLSGDSEGRDRSIRLWDLSSGKSLSVYTPSKQITACELTSNGKFITLALKNKRKLVTLQLSDGSNGNAIESNDDSAIYGDKENEGKVFNLND
ncbi:hypothetical protein ACKWTF_006289 [Chironomus riparius]